MRLPLMLYALNTLKKRPIVVKRKYNPCVDPLPTWSKPCVAIYNTYEIYCYDKDWNQIPCGDRITYFNNCGFYAELCSSTCYGNVCNVDFIAKSVGVDTTNKTKYEVTYLFGVGNYNLQKSSQFIELWFYLYKGRQFVKVYYYQEGLPSSAPYPNYLEVRVYVDSSRNFTETKRLRLLPDSTNTLEDLEFKVEIDITNGNLYVYVDGVLQCEKTNNDVVKALSLNPMYIYAENNTYAFGEPLRVMHVLEDITLY